ncbi:MAG: TerB family tellurite resistance protein [Alphaproteobacteria bacterium]|nr:TerB family tellurite resistance protein [Alphaproteobacteria bacterium]
MSNMLENNEMTCLSKMTEDDKMVFIKVLARLAQSDGDFDEGERQFVYDLFDAFGLPEIKKDKLTKITDEEAIKEAAKITDRYVAMELIKEMCMLANSDGDLTERETMLIGNVGLAMNLELEKIEQISRWVIDRIIWLEEGKLIFEKV